MNNLNLISIIYLTSAFILNNKYFNNYSKQQLKQLKFELRCNKSDNIIIITCKFKRALYVKRIIVETCIWKLCVAT